MTIFVELITNPVNNAFANNLKRTQGALGSRTQRAGRLRVRRPTRGLEIKDDTYATLKVVRADGTPIPLVDSGSEGGRNTDGYANFLLQSVSESRMEKHQIIETFGASYVFFFGESPRFLDVSAALLNSHNFNWEAEWWTNYNMYLRGTKLVEMGARCYLSYDDTVVEGYLMQAQAVKSSDQQFLANLQFRFFVTNCYNVNQVGNHDFPIRASAIVPLDIQLTSGDAGRQLISNLQGEPMARALNSVLSVAGEEAAARQGQIGQGRAISNMVRNMPASFAVSADWWPLLESRSELFDMTVRTNRPLRARILDNFDEYVGTFQTEANLANYQGLDNRARTQQEADDLFQEAIQFLSCYGANINSPAIFASLGFQATFSASAGVSASFGAVAGGAGFGFSAGVGVGLGAVAGGSVNTAPTVPGQSITTASAQTDSLAVVYGRAQIQTPNYIEATSFAYGYPSDYTPGPGFGKAGFGNYGGPGFGSGLSLGDPGYVAPNKFTFAGVADQASAFERFLRPKNDGTALTPGLSVGMGVVAGGASVAVGGVVSAFALVSIEGTLSPFGDALSSPSAMSTRQQLTRHGYNVPNPYGVDCANGFGIGVSAGAYAGIGASAGVGVGLL